MGELSVQEEKSIRTQAKQSEAEEAPAQTAYSDYLGLIIFASFLGICGLIYTTTIDDFGSNVDRTSVRLNDEWAKALDDDDEGE